MANRNTILIADDMEVSRAILKEIFKDEYDILEAADGNETMTVIHEHLEDIAVVLLDIVMPKIDGFNVLAIMAKENLLSHIPVVFITAASNMESEKRGYDLGVSDIISKPFDPYLVKRRVENVIDLYKHKNDLEYLVQVQTKKLSEQAQKLKESNDFIIDALSTVVEFRDLESGEHIRRIKTFTNILLLYVVQEYKEYNLSDEDIELITSASAMHDIGKIAIPDCVLLKPGRLTVEEFEIMKQHTVKGCAILRNLSYIDNKKFYTFCYDICRSHHERWDGKGYPDNLAGDDIPICAQVVSIADVYDALVSPRVYKEPFSHDETVRMILDGECGTFSPKLLHAFTIVENEFATVSDGSRIR